MTTPGPFSITLPCASPRWVLQGTDRGLVEGIAAGLIGAGVVAETITSGTAYRLQGPQALLEVVAAELAPTEVSLAIEPAPADSITMSTTLAPVAARRTVTVHGSRGAFNVMRAVDYGLHVTPAGAHRWTVAGPTGVLVAWLAYIWEMSEADAAKRFGLGAETIAREDSPTPAVVVNLPTRQTVTDITRDPAGDIKTVVQIERTLKEQA